MRQSRFSPAIAKLGLWLHQTPYSAVEPNHYWESASQSGLLPLKVGGACSFHALAAARHGFLALIRGKTRTGRHDIVTSAAARAGGGPATAG